MNNPIQKHLIDSEFTILKTDFQFFKKEFILYLEMDTKGKKQRRSYFIQECIIIIFLCRQGIVFKRCCLWGKMDFEFILLLSEGYWNIISPFN
nr:hypothetical protein P5645_01710 [Bacillus subtilis]